MVQSLEATGLVSGLPHLLGQTLSPRKVAMSFPVTGKVRMGGLRGGQSSEIAGYMPAIKGRGKGACQ